MEAIREDLKIYSQKQELAYFKNNCNSVEIMTPLHWHNAYEVLYVRRGFGEQRINSKTMPLKAGDIVIILPSDIHSTKSLSEKGCDIDVLQFTDSFLYGAQNIKNELNSGIKSADEKIKIIFDKMNQYSKEEAGNPQLAAGLTHLLIGFLLKRENNKSNEKITPLIEKVCNYLENTADLRLESVARHFNYSQEHLSRQFSASMGVSYRDWCDRIRMRRALEMLTKADTSISVIAVNLGYSDSSSFIRAFKRMYGITPNVCRKRQMFI